MYTVHFAKTNLSKLLQMAEDGKQVVLARGKKPIARLVPCSQLPNPKRPQVGTTTSPLLKVVENREVAGQVGDAVLYF
ncbi:MAG: type II toxin-antitoxin system Phd/YefM family antitoxin [Opitutales bacterium]|jgi:antitoxin (DNA-binding transcriptional repressor) of toxin-antitoxin stability system|tara:strand:- start:194 stop:427 length:234 start_codon:yes stop_codon:yes gene_type:complete